MEFAIRTVPELVFELPTDDTTVSAVTYSKNGAPPVTISPVTSGTKVTAKLPYQDSEGRIVVTWTFNVPDSGVYTDQQTHDVVTPLLSRAQIKEIVPDFTDQQVDLMESGVRHTIYSITGQTFGKFNGTYRVKGSRSNTLYLPDRLLELDNVNGLANSNSLYSIDGGGFRLSYYPWGVPPVKADFYGLYQEAFTGVIHNPNYISIGKFYENATYDVTGTWGHQYVPGAVTDAARILVDEYSCMDSEYRDRFLISMTAADWRIQFYEGAFTGTGNARADKLLEPHVKPRRWVAI
jgi:hypothetical protein